MTTDLCGRLAAILSTGLLFATVAHADEGERISELLSRGAEEQKARLVHENIWLSSGNSNSYRVVTPEGSVIIDTGLGIQAKHQQAELYYAHDGSPPKYVVLTHAHPDHIGGVGLYRRLAPDVTVIGHRAIVARNRDQLRLEKFRDRRARLLWAAVMPLMGGPALPELNPEILVDDRYVFELGGVEFHVIATPGGEGPDAVSVWIPKHRVLFTGDALGPSVGTFPNLFTLRGENLREAVPMIDSLERMRKLNPRLLLPGHFEPVEGEQKIQDLLKRTAEAVRYVHNETVQGMNEGKDVFTLMQEIELPEHLAISEQYGRVAWGVRAIWESYTGWFRYESTTELYPYPASSIYGELGAMIDAKALAARANQHTSEGRPEQALHFVEIALANDPKNQPALEARLAALRALQERDGRGNFQLGGWLRERIAQTEAALSP